MLPHADFVVCLDGRGGIAAACPPSELSAALSLSMKENADPHVLNSSGDGGTGKKTSDSDSHNHTGVDKDTDISNNQGVESRVDIVDGGVKPVRRTLSNGFFDLLSALPRMGNDTPKETVDDSIIADKCDVGNIRGADTNEVRDENQTKVKKGLVDNVPQDAFIGMTKKFEKNISSEGQTEEAIESGNGEDEVPKEAVLLVGKEFKGSGSVSLSIYCFYFNSGGGVLAVLLVIISNLFLPTSWYVQECMCSILSVLPTVFSSFFSSFLPSFLNDSVFPPCLPSFFPCFFDSLQCEAVRNGRQSSE